MPTSATAPAPTAPNPREHDGLTISPAYDGTTIVQAELSSTAAEIVVTAIHALTDPPSDGDTRTPARRRADALVQMAELALAAIQRRRPTGRPGPCPSCSVVIDWTTLTGETGAGSTATTPAPSTTPTSNGSCVTAPSAGSSPAPTASPSTSAGPDERSHPSSDERWPSATTAAATPDAHRPHGWTRAHHVIHWNDGGTTVLVNLVSLCDHHHHVVHLPGWTAKFDGHTFTVFTTRRHRSHVATRGAPMPSSGVEIRTFESTDADAVVALWQACELTRPWNDPRKDIARKLAVDDGLFLVGTVGGDVVASVMAGYDGHRGWVNYLAVDPSRRGEGHGRTLMQEAETLLAARGCPKVNLQVRDTNAEALAFYERLGYVVDAAVSMGKRLESDDA